MDCGRNAGSALGTAAGTEIGSFGLTNWPLYSGAAYWLNPRAGLTPDGSLRVPSWTDQIAGEAFAESTDANKPTYDSTGINGRPGIKFTRPLSQRLMSTGSIGGILDESQAYTLLAGIRTAPGTTQTYFGIGSSANTRSINHGHGSSGVDRYIRTIAAGTSTSTDGTSILTAGTHVVAQTYTGAAISSRIDGAVSISAAANTRAPVCDRACVGSLFANGSFSSSFYYDGWIGDIVIFTSAISDVLRAAGERWMALRYGVVLA